jgi:mono/diheme cytochrome c family protein
LLLLEKFYGMLAAIGLTQRVHLLFAHVPIGLVAGALFFSLGAYIWKRRNLRLSAGHALVLAFIFIFPTVLFGVFDWMYFYGASLTSAIKMKMLLSVVVFLLLAAGIILRGEKRVKPGVMLGIYALAFAAMIGLGRFGADLGLGQAGAQPAQQAPPGEQVPAGGEQPAAGKQQAVAQAAQQPPAEEQAPVKAAVAGRGAAPASQEDIASGKVIFASNCQACHAGGGNAVIAELPLKKAKQLESFEEFSSFIHDPRMPDGSKGPMPAFSPEKLSDAQDRKLYAYILSMLDDPAWQ